MVVMGVGVLMVVVMMGMISVHAQDGSEDKGGDEQDCLRSICPYRYSGGRG